MMISILKTLCLCCLVGITYQDFKERKVYLWLLIVLGVLFASLFFRSTSLTLFAIHIGVNILTIALLMFILFCYAKFRLQKPLEECIGLGDLLFFLCIAIGFPIATFIVLFTCSLFFTVIMFWGLQAFLDSKTIPLAGLQALFLLLLISSNWSFQFINLYMI